MANYEKVNKGLECCVIKRVAPDAVRHCGICPYNRELNGEMDFGCQNDLICDTLELLKEQEPRMMTTQNWEANYIEKMPVWIEWSESAKDECADNGKVDGWAILNVDEFVDVLCFGGRCWTTRPTDEQRKAVKWDD